MSNFRVLLFLTCVVLSISSTGCRPTSSGTDAPQPKVAAARNGLTVEVPRNSTVYSPRGIFNVKIRFHNAGPNAVTILKPLDGSTDCWHMPYYRFTVSDPDGKPLKLMPRCGNSGLWAGTQWPKDYLVEIQPNASFDIEESLPFKIERDGPHTISFEYQYEPSHERFTPPAGAWRGSVKAPLIVLNLQRK